jgi:hypothetical protein
MNAQAAAVAEAEQDDVLSSPEDLILNSRYRIVRSAPLPSYGTSATQAYRVEDKQHGPLDLYALVGDQTLPPRSEEIAVLIDFDHRHLVRLVDAGTVPFSGPGTAHQTIILQFPAGGHVMPPQGAHAMIENDVKRRIMGPVIEALSALHEQSIVHRAVHPHNLFYADELGRQVVLGDGVSCVPGQCQPSAFEPLERASVAPLGRGRGGREADVHAFGATILALLMGRLPGAEIPTEDLVDARMERGSLRALMGDFRCSRNMERLLGGMMSDTPEERWSLHDVEQWLLGEHVSGVVVPRLLNPIKPFPFQEREYQSTRAVAEAFNRQWNDAAAEIQTGRLEKWLASSRERLAMAESVTALRETWAGGGSKMGTDELISRICNLLDVDGPICYKGMSVSIDGIGPLLAQAYLEGREDQAQKIGAMIGMGLPMVWISADNERRKAMASSTAKFTRIRQYIKKSELGYGLERCLYELNPTMRCLSPLTEPDACGDAGALLGALNVMGAKLGETTPWTDRHIAAFIAAAFHPRSDATLASTKMPDDLRATQTLGGLILFATAQGRSKLPLFPRLTRAMGPDTMEIVGSYRSRTTRANVTAEVERLLDAGDISAIVTKLTNSELQAKDLDEYRNAVTCYRQANAEISVLKVNASRRRAQSVLIGRRIAAWIAFVGLMATTVMVLSGLAP